MINARLPDGSSAIIVLFITGGFNLGAEMNGACLEGRSGLVSFKTSCLDELLVSANVALLMGFEPMTSERRADAIKKAMAAAFPVAFPILERTFGSLDLNKALKLKD